MHPAASPGPTSRERSSWTLRGRFAGAAKALGEHAHRGIVAPHCWDRGPGAEVRVWPVCRGSRRTSEARDGCFDQIFKSFTRLDQRLHVGDIALELLFLALGPGQSRGGYLAIVAEAVQL